ncbi:uncharacterized protein B0H64DRAFT_432815 [Chaetomium fimeti]|uniref:HNH nuclease domain-containing protein n=1 Tax=Chaetomium fimeti TaxID=1854472 RepID=A0AAE0LST8_9PEZI|nr:hypothetical protein B0H64DRAFT_432815 [Chaetomium fimeti]
MAPSHHRYQPSFEGIMSVSDEAAMGAAERALLKNKFQRIINHFDRANGTTNTGGDSQYNRPRLVRLTYEYARSEASKDMLLRAFFLSTGLSLNDDDLDFENGEEELNLGLSRFADYLFESLFLPLRASALKTLQLSPSVPDRIGTPERIADLRTDCLARDRHRCVVSRRFDIGEAAERSSKSGAMAEDDDGRRLVDDTRFAKLEVAHPLPRSITEKGSSPQLPPSKKAALDILNMLDRGVTDVIQGTDIDGPRNAITLSAELHQMFSNFQVFFEALSGREHTYRVQTFVEPYIMPDLPVERTLYLSESRSIEPPLPRLLALHSAIAHILHLSGAGIYIDKIVKELEWRDTREDGTTELGQLVALRLDGWIDAVLLR